MLASLWGLRDAKDFRFIVAAQPRTDRADRTFFARPAARCYRLQFSKDSAIMKASIRHPLFRSVTAPLAVLLLGVASAYAETSIVLALDGAAEVPPVTTTASATGRISVQDDHLLKGSIDVSAIEPTAAHIHEAAAVFPDRCAHCARLTSPRPRPDR